ncbi:hypothetical protein [Acinetobacter guerrae]|uniref:hypothetical protein n=1 Tax=Acinetobacter guerrae TaxID=1843371 RepID=UPI00125F88A7|nr:hypothetical protein [Acinetobacter guerrae]
MNNYKIRVNNEAESKEAQELFFELGYAWVSMGKTQVKIASDCTHLTVYSDGELAMGRGDADQELTLPQLRDLVVLHRNDVEDATHVGKSGSEYYVTDIEEVYFFDGIEWVLKDVDVSKLKPIKNQEGLISGADALRALIDGLSVEMTDAEIGMEWTEICKKEGGHKGKVEPCLWMFLNQPEYIQFRLKPRTILISGIEVPAPCEPKIGEECWVLNESLKYKDGYKLILSHEEGSHYLFGSWRTEEEIKQVVYVLRKVLGMQS